MPTGSIQEFLGSFCFIQKLTDCSSIESLLGVDYQEPIFTVNEDDQLSLTFFGSILKGIHKVKSLTFRTEDPLEWLLAHLSEAFANLTVLKVCSKTYTSVSQGETFDGLFQETLTTTLAQFTTSDYCEQYLNIILADEIYRRRMLREVLKYCHFSDRRPAVYLYLQDGERTDLSKLLHENVHKVHVLGTKPANVTLTRDVMHCPNLSHLSIVSRLTLEERVFLELEKAVYSGNLSSQRHLSLAGATFVDSKQDFRILSKRSFLRHLNLFGCEVSDRDIKALSLLKTTSLVASGDTTLKLLTLALENDNVTRGGPFDMLSHYGYHFYRKSYVELTKVLGQKQLSHRTKPGISMTRQEYYSLTDLKPNLTDRNVPYLTLERCVTSLDDLQHLSEIVTGWELTCLNISHSSGISGHLSVLLKRSFTFLRTLILSDCGLHSDDLRSLAEARVNDRLRTLRYLDISQNTEDVGSLFSFECKWGSLLSLNVRNDTSRLDCLNVLQRYVELGYLYSLQTLRFYVDVATTFHSGERGTPWPNLTTMEIVSTINDVEHGLTYARDTIATKCFPKLRTVCVVAKPKVDPNPETHALGDDWSDMFSTRHTSEFQHQSESVPVRETDKQFAEAMHELKKLGIEVHVWFSGDGTIYQESGVV